MVMPIYLIFVWRVVISYAWIVENFTNRFRPDGSLLSHYRLFTKDCLATPLLAATTGTTW